MKILHVDASILGESSVSRQLSGATEGLNVSAEQRKASIAAATAEVGRLAA